MNLRKLISVFATLSILLPSIALSYEFTSQNFVRNIERPDNQMRITMQGPASLRSYRFVGRVGGVNFEGIVDLSDFDIDLEYDPHKPNGERASITLDGREYKIPLYDWELRPIVNYADSEFTAVASIFGDGPDMERYRYIDYHPAFEDTHLGMRLLQADIILMDPITFSEAPKVSGEAVYMAGEQRERSEAERMIAALRVFEMMSTHEFQAWVLTDTDLEPELITSADTVSVDLEPYFFFWKSDSSGAQGLIERFNSEVELAQPLSQQYDTAFTAYQRAPAGSTEEQRALREVQRLEQQLEPVVNRINALRAQIDEFEPEIEDVPELTTMVHENSEVYRSVAPFVFDAVYKTAQYAALFRGAKARNSSDWKEFHREIMSEIQLAPARTPNQFDR